MMNNAKLLPASLIGCLFLFGSYAVQAESGADVFKSACQACHKVEPADFMIAPPITGIVTHYKAALADQSSFEAKIQQWVLDPKAEDSLMPHAIERFQIMPKLGLQPEQVSKVASFLYQADFSKIN